MVARSKKSAQKHVIPTLLGTLIVLLVTGVLTSLFVSTKQPLQTNTAQAAETKTITMTPSAPSDYANEDGQIVQLYTSIPSTIWIGTGENVSNSYLGLRFSSQSPLPAGARIVSARIDVVSQREAWIPLSTSFYAETAVNPALFSNNSKPSQREKTSISQSVSDNVKWLTNTRYTYDVTNVLQSLPNTVDRSTISILAKGGATKWGRKYIVGGVADDTLPRLTIVFTPSGSSTLPSPTPLSPTATPSIKASPSPTRTPTASPLPTMAHDNMEEGMAMNMWSSSGKNKPNPKYDKCDDGTDIVRAHKTFHVIAPDGKKYPTWHPSVVKNPITGVGNCTFGHEHGRNPANSLIYRQAKEQYYFDANKNGQMDSAEEAVAGIPFGYIAEQTDVWAAASGRAVMRHEDHVGHKIDYANDETDLATHIHDTTKNAGVVVASLANFPQNARTGARCFYLSAAHQGTSTNDAFTNNLHEVYYFVDCRHSDSRYNQKASIGIMETFGRVGGFTKFMPMCGIERRSNPQDFVNLGVTDANRGYPSETNGSDREIQTRDCIEKGFLVPDGQFSGNLYEAWPATLDIFTADNRQLVGDINLLFDVEDANRYYYPEDLKKKNGYSNPDAGLNLGFTMDLCYENLNGRAARGGACMTTTNYGQTKGIRWDDPRSGFRGINRGMYFKPPILTNASGPQLWYTDPFGRSGKTTPFVGSVKQRIESKNINYSTLIGKSIDPRVNNRLHDGTGVHAPN